MKELHILCHSSAAMGAENISADGSRFTVNLKQPLPLQRARNIKVSVESARVWYTFLNVFQGVNDKIYITLGNAAEVVLTIPQGLYELTELDSAMKLAWAETAGTPSTDLPISITPNWSTQRVNILNVSDLEQGTQDEVSIDFAQADTFREILGFDAGTVTIPVGMHESGDNVARFNLIDNILVGSDLCEGMRINNSYNNVLSEIPLDSAPHKQIIYEPFRPISIQADELARRDVQAFDLWLMDQELRPIHVNDETWSVRIRISWDE